MSAYIEPPDAFDKDASVQRGGFGEGRLEQLPRQTNKKALASFYAFILPCFITAVITQVLVFIPSLQPHVSRLPYIAVGTSLLLVGVSKLIKRDLPMIVVLGVAVGAMIGL